MTATTNAEDLRKYKSRVSLIVELMLPLNSNTNMVREVKKICLQISNKLRHDLLR